MKNVPLSYPFQLFRNWFAEAEHCDAIHDATAMCLATANLHGAPSARIVLLKHMDENGFTFFTNKNSRKSEEMKRNQSVALCFYWAPLNKQVRIEGYVENVSEEESDAYFNSRARESRIGAWASQQSAELDGVEKLQEAFAHYQQQFKNKDIPRPSYWGGWRVIPTRMEFWQDGAHRLHKREVFVRFADGWEAGLLYP